MGTPDQEETFSDIRAGIRLLRARSWAPTRRKWMLNGAARVVPALASEGATNQRDGCFTDP